MIELYQSLKAGKAYKYVSIMLLLALVSLALCIAAIHYIDSQAMLADNGIFACKNITVCVNTLWDNIKTIEHDVQIFTPIPSKLIDSNLRLIKIIDHNTVTYGIDIDYRYTAEIKNYSAGLNSQSLNPKSFSSTYNIDNSLYQIFSGAQRSSVIFHNDKKYFASLSNRLFFVEKSLLLVSVMLAFLFTVTSILRFFRSPLKIHPSDLSTNHEPFHNPY